MVWIGLGLQLTGLTLAVWALVTELRAGSVPNKPPAGFLDDRKNPWQTRIVTQVERDVESARHPSSVPPRDPVDPQAMTVKLMVQHMSEREKLLAEDWEAQKRAEAATRGRLVKLVYDHQGDLTERHRATQRRITLEMAGLLLAIIGTVVSTVAGRA